MIKDYLKTLFPVRWIIILLFILCVTYVIYIGFLLEDPNNPQYFKNPYVWYIGNVMYWFIIDFFFGLGMENLWRRNKKKKIEKVINYQI